MPGGLDAMAMQQLLGGAGAAGLAGLGGLSKPSGSKKSTPKKSGASSGLPTSMQTSMPNMEMLRQQEQLLQLSLAGQLKPEELQLLAQQVTVLWSYCSGELGIFR